jgi:hypothetical protein
MPNQSKSYFKSKYLIISVCKTTIF